MTDTLRVLVSDSLAEEGLAIFREAEGIELDFRPGLSPDELKAVIGEYDGLAIRSGTKVTAEVLAAAERLRVVGRAGIGVDNVDLEAASRRGIVVMNTPGGNTITTAEHTVAMLMAVSRHIPQATASMKAGKWEKKKFEGRELFNKSLGIVGLGNIGKVVASRARGLGMKIIAYDPFLSEDAARRMDVELVDLEAIWKRSDYVTVHVPLTDETRHLIDDEAIAKMKDGVFIINCARGGIVDEDALARALDSGKVGGAAFDVFETEPPPEDHPLLSRDRFVCTPHLGASTEEAQKNVAIAVAEQIVGYLQSGLVVNAVNVPSVSREILTVLGPFLDLAERLGSVVGQLGPKNPTEVVVETAGDLNEHPMRPVAVAALKGMLRHYLDVPVNEVNAPHLARERGLDLVEQRESTHQDYTSLVRVRARGPSGELAVAGTIFGRGDPRIVQYGRFSLEAVPEGHILVCHNKDQPGVVGRIGTILGDAKVNIARMQLALDPERGEALALVNVDVPPSDALLEALRAIPHMIGVEDLKL
jgi:(S)-sulfolactate dehydrogenase